MVEYNARCSYCGIAYPKKEIAIIRGRRMCKKCRKNKKKVDKNFTYIYRDGSVLK